MNRLKLTKSTIDPLPSPAKEIIWWDTELKGFEGAECTTIGGENLGKGGCSSRVQ
jgi:hypothetical protein